MKIFLARPRGFCAGVERAIEIVERALSRFGAPVYVRHEIVHNAVVVESLRAKGAVFVDELADVPSDSWLVFSAHGVSPAVVHEASERHLRVIDATCPLVTRVHNEAKVSSQQGHTILLVGHRNHVEVEGVVGEAPENTIVVETVEEAESLEVPNPDLVSVLTQTTLSIDEASSILGVLRNRFPALRTQKQDDICYATTNRQEAVKALSEHVDVWLVIGDPTSSNSNRLREIGAAPGIPSHLILAAEEIQEEWLEGKSRIGITSGASTPEVSVQGVLDRLRSLGATEIVEHEGPAEPMEFSLPHVLRTEEERRHVGLS